MPEGEVVQRGVTSAGQSYVLSVARADDVVCATVEYGSLADGSKPRGPLTLGRSRICADPRERPLVANVGQLLVDPRSGEIVDRPFRFVYGIARQSAEEIELRAPGADKRPLETGVALRATAVPGTEIKVFTGSPSRLAGTGTGLLLARDKDGVKIGEQDLRFVGPKSTPPSELTPPSEHH